MHFFPSQHDHKLPVQSVLSMCQRLCSRGADWAPASGLRTMQLLRASMQQQLDSWQQACGAACRSTELRQAAWRRH